MSHERLDVKINSHGWNDERKAKMRGKHFDIDNLDQVLGSSTIDELINSQKSVFLPYIYVI